MEDPEAPDFTTAFIELFESVLRRTTLLTDRDPMGTAWHRDCVLIWPSFRFNARAERRPSGMPLYRYNVGSAVALLDACNALAADPSFFPEVAFEASANLHVGPGAYAQRFVDYGVPGTEELYVPLPDFTEDDRRLSLFDQIFAMASRFLALHEQGHYFLGHLHFAERHNSSGQPVWLEVQEERPSGIPAAAARALELQADRFAFELLFRIGTRLREEAVTAEGPLDEIATYEEWLVKAALGGLLVCGIFEVGERSCRKPAEQRSHPPAATRTIALITGLRAAMVEHLASAAGADAVLARVVRNAQRIYGLLGVPPLAENAMYAWMNRDSYTNEAISEYREAARILRDMRHELREDEAAVHSLFGVPHPDDESSGLLE